MKHKNDEEFAARNVIFAPDGKAPDTRTCEDIVVIATFAQKFYERLGIDLSQAWTKFHSVFDKMSQVLIQNTSLNSPSVFKRCAAFTLGFLEVSPIEQSFAGVIGKTIADINNHQNAIVAFAYCRQCLTRAEFEHPPGTRVNLERGIKVSKHYYCDLIHAMSVISVEPNRAASFHLLSLIYEGLCYNENTDASDERTVGLEQDAKADKKS